MDKKSYIQISIIFGIILIVVFVYFGYFKDSNIKQVNNEVYQKDQKIIKGNDDLITEMSYYSEDNKGNRYEINSESGVINPDNSNLILMDKVTAVKKSQLAQKKPPTMTIIMIQPSVDLLIWFMATIK